MASYQLNLSNATNQIDWIFQEANIFIFIYSLAHIHDFQKRTLFTVNYNISARIKINTYNLIHEFFVGGHLKNLKKWYCGQRSQWKNWWVFLCFKHILKKVGKKSLKNWKKNCPVHPNPLLSIVARYFLGRWSEEISSY